MRRFSPWQGCLAMILGLAVLLTSSGCTQALLTALYLAGADKVQPECTLLQKKKVVVVCRSEAGSQYQDPRMGRQLSRSVAQLLRENGKSIQVIDQRKVEKWTDENDWNDYLDVGKAMDAEMVLAIDIDSFSLYQGQTLYQGRASGDVKVFDCKTKDVAWEKTIMPVVYPPNTCIHTADQTEQQFRSVFLGVLAERIARHFYTFDPNDDIGMDAKSVQ